MKQLLFILALTTPFLATGAAAADRLPPGYPQELRQADHPVYGSGTIDRIDFGGHEVVIDDRLYRFSEQTAVTSRSSRNDSQGRLRKGVKVGFKLGDAGAQEGYIETFWLLPSRFRPDDDE
ncbi:MAG TPA: hypothetical protein VK971_04815 [Thiohalobacter sp.]|nr:hypothetical protein [Thiohalobacter sp.]